jgi:hypothetical protein
MKLVISDIVRVTVDFTGNERPEPEGEATGKYGGSLNEGKHDDTLRDSYRLCAGVTGQVGRVPAAYQERPNPSAQGDPKDRGLGALRRQDTTGAHDQAR